MGLEPALLRGIFSCGLEKPSPIQQRVIRPIADGRDTIGQSPSGAGKTTAFLIGALARITFSATSCQGLGLAPTRELAQQIHKAACTLGEQHLGLRCHACVGGTAWREDAKALRAGQHLVVGTPGRVLDLIEKGVLGVASLRVFILDEADEMLSCGFKDQIYSIFRTLHPAVQACIFSATLPSDVLELAAKFMREPVRILPKSEQLSVNGVNQFYVAVEKEAWKLDVLLDLFESLTIAQSIVYCNTQRKVDYLYKEMCKHEIAVSVMHGGLGPEERQRAMRDFGSGASRMLVATDLLSRGIDVQPASLVVNYDLPQSAEQYFHRIGRSGCFGRQGAAISFVADKEIPWMREIERRFATQISELPADLADVI